ncbi:MAG: hypothetical protein HC867_05905 [Bacteroidia bacterium]|nr:hypothetical protein [Bacteroidia bacterium]
MKQNLLKWSIPVLMAVVILSACKKDKGEGNEEEVITTMILRFTPVGGGAALEYSFDDPDGPGGGAPTKQQIVLATNTTYNVTVQLLNKTENPPADITTEVAAEADAHRFYYEPIAGSNIAVSNLNNDGNGIPLGTTSTWTTTTAATGKVTVTLRHYAGNPPNKAAADPVNSSKSSTDIEVEFDTSVQ